MRAMTRRKSSEGPSGARGHQDQHPPADRPWDASWNAPDRRKPGGSHTGPGPHLQRRSDDKIREEILELLTNNADLDASEVELHVEGGEVTLTGSVDSRDAKWLTEDLVNSVTGVREVNNRLKVAR
jgi:osmotically-inducible protein OsmY